MSDLEEEQAQPTVVDETSWLLQRARQGDDAVLPELRELLDARPELWNYYGDLAGHARESWLQLIAGTDLAVKESLARKADELGRELAGEQPSAVERLLVDRIVLCWLQLHHAEVAGAHAMRSPGKLADFWLKRQNGAHRRYMSSIGALAMMRRLLPSAARGPSHVQMDGVPIGGIGGSRETDPIPQLRVIGQSGSA